MPNNLKLNRVEKEKIQEQSQETPSELSEKREQISVPENPSSPEQAGDKQIEGLGIEKGSDTQEIGGIVASGQAGKRAKEQEKKIEKIMERDLDDIFLKMPEYKRGQFKMAGEQTAREINRLLQNAKVKVGKIIDLLKKWLSLIPGVNKFFLEQEAKIKADEIMKIKSNNS